MTRRIPPWTYSLGAVVVMAGAFLVIQMPGVQPGSPLFWLMAGLVAVMVAGLIAIAWQRTDEAARAAQKAAWFWGGAGGIIVWSVALNVLHLAGINPGKYAERLTGSAFGGGGISLMLTQLVGMLLAWAIWWVWAGKEGRA